MWIRLMVRPWWVGTTVFALWSLVCIVGVVAYERAGDGADPNPLTLPAFAIALIVVAGLGFGTLLFALSAPQRRRNLDALRDTHTPQERSQAVTAAYRGAIPDDPRVRAAAARVAWVHLSAYRKSPSTYRVIYPLLAAVWIVLFVLTFADHSHQMWMDGAQAVLWSGLAVWSRLTWPKLERRVKLLGAGATSSRRLSDEPGR
jgi:hypothetical protein